MESGYCLPTPPISQQMMEVSGGTSKPAILREFGGRLSHALRIDGPVAA